MLKLVWSNRLDFACQRLMGYGFVKHEYFHQYGYKPRIIRSKQFYSLRRFKPVPICIHGHFDVYPEKGNLLDVYPDASQFITFFRDPLDMELSMYFFRKRLREKGFNYYKGEKKRLDPAISLNQYLSGKKSYMLTTIPWEINEKNYIDIIESNFVFIGILEEFEKSVKILSRILNKKPASSPYKIMNQSQRDEIISEEVKQAFISRNPLEFLVYNYVRKKIQEYII